MAFSSHPKGRPQVTTTSTRLWCPAVLVKTREKREGVTYASKVGTIYVPIHQVQYVAQYPDGTSIRTLKTKNQFLRRPFQLSVNEVFRMKAEHLSFKMKFLAS